MCRCRCRRGQMHIVEELFLNPFEKWVVYGRFPCKFVVHLILSVVVTAQAVIYFQRDIEHVSRTNQHFVHMFTSPDPLHSPYALQDGVSSLITNHFLINNRSIVRYQLQSPNELVLHLSFRNGERGELRVSAEKWIESFNKQRHLEYLEVIFPLLFDLDDLPLLREIKAYQRMDEVGYSCKESSCHDCIYHWELVTSFDGRAAGDFITLLDAKAVDCQGKEWQAMHWISISVALLALLSLGLVCRKVGRSLKVIHRFRASSQTWARLTYSDIASMMSIWWAVTMLSNALQLVAAVFCLQTKPEIGIRFTWVGFSCFCTWLNMIQYFESFPSYFIAFHTISKGGVRILQLFFSVAPFFFAFILLGVCLFWKSAMFANPESAAEVLFSLMNGDSIHDAFKEVRSVGGIMLQAYLYVFVFFAIYVILNINIGIIEDAFHEAKHRSDVRHLNDAPAETDTETFSLRVRRAIEEESPDLDTLELLYGRHVGSSADIGEGLAQNNNGQTSIQPTERASASLDSDTMGGRGSVRSMFGKYISPRYLECPNLQEALGSNFFDRGRSVSLPVQRTRGVRRHLDPSARSSLVRPPGPGPGRRQTASGASSESQRGLEVQEEMQVPIGGGARDESPKAPEMEMRVVDPVQEALEEIYVGSAHLRARIPNASGELLQALERLEHQIREVGHLFGHGT